MKIFHSPKKDIDFTLKKFEKKMSLSHHIIKEKKDKK
jgi:hypothetical protein